MLFLEASENVHYSLLSDDVVNTSLINGRVLTVAGHGIQILFFELGTKIQIYLIRTATCSR